MKGYKWFLERCKSQGIKVTIYQDGSREVTGKVEEIDELGCELVREIGPTSKQFTYVEFRDIRMVRYENYDTRD